LPPAILPPSVQQPHELISTTPPPPLLVLSQAASPLAGDAAEGVDDLVSRATLSEATVVLRWERLVGRLAAAAAQRKVVLLLTWLQLHLAFTEGSSSRGNWLSHKVQNMPRCVLEQVPHTCTVLYCTVLYCVWHGERKAEERPC